VYSSYTSAVRGLVVWREIGKLLGNTPVRVGEHLTVLHIDAGYRTFNT